MYAHVLVLCPPLGTIPAYDCPAHVVRRELSIYMHTPAHLFRGDNGFAVRKAPTPPHPGVAGEGVMGSPSPTLRVWSVSFFSHLHTHTRTHTTHTGTHIFFFWD